MLDSLREECALLGKPQWRDLLTYVAELHSRSVHRAGGPFPYPWEEIGPGYCYGPAFGHWDIVHQTLDVLPAEPEHARNQILNNLANQTEDGLVPGSIWMRGAEPRWSVTCGHPPVWPVAVQDYCDLMGSMELAELCLEPLIRQIRWFEICRKAESEGFLYLDILEHKWESGVDEGVRFDDIQPRRYACVDATSHVAMLYEYASVWSEALGKSATEFADKHASLQCFITNELFDEETGFFHDVWAVGKPERRRLTFDGIWPLVAGAASPGQAKSVIDCNLLDAERFFTRHPISTIAVCDPAFELRLWRGPAWNSITYWAARGCAGYGRTDAALRLLEGALDASAKQFGNTGTVWEFYHPYGENPLEVARKPHTRQNTPCPDYLGHNPLIAMARLWQSLGSE